MNGSYGNNNNNNNFIVHLRGLPWNATQAEVEDVLKDCKIRETNFTTDDDGRTTGECFVILESQEDLDLAKTFHQTSLGNRKFKLFSSEVYLLSPRFYRSSRFKFRRNGSDDSK